MVRNGFRPSTVWGGVELIPQIRGLVYREHGGLAHVDSGFAGAAVLHVRRALEDAWGKAIKRRVPYLEVFQILLVAPSHPVP